MEVDDLVCKFARGVQNLQIAEVDMKLKLMFMSIQRIEKRLSMLSVLVALDFLATAALIWVLALVWRT